MQIRRMEEYLRNNNTIRFASNKSKVLVINTGGTFSLQFVSPGRTGEVYFTKNYLLTELKSGFYPRLNYNNDMEETFLENDNVKVTRIT